MTTTDEVKAQIAFHRKHIATSKGARTCRWCKTVMVYVPYTEAVEEGHIYSPEGLKEAQDITGWCEWCFDKATPEDEELEDEGPNPDALNG